MVMAFLEIGVTKLSAGLVAWAGAQASRDRQIRDRHVMGALLLARELLAPGDFGLAKSGREKDTAS
jgi:hypothetical protein